MYFFIQNTVLHWSDFYGLRIRAYKRSQIRLYPSMGFLSKY